MDDEGRTPDPEPAPPAADPPPIEDLSPSEEPPGEPLPPFVLIDGFRGGREPVGIEFTKADDTRSLVKTRRDSETD
jgi:hypothetical protein